jgi:hypothetical protein
MSSKNESQGMRDSAVVESPASSAWDPYDVWLNRVKKPRDEQSGTGTTQTIRIAGADPSETARLRALTLNLSR